jgi:RNA polymerase sigma-70 factor (ECF subfamily)
MEGGAGLENQIGHKTDSCDEKESAFTGIVKRYYEKIFKFCCYALGGNRSFAEDCTQDIFLILYESMAKLKDYDKIGGWLYKTADHISKQYAASLRRERKIAAAPFVDSGDAESPENRIASKNIRSEEDRIAEEKAIDRAACEIHKRLKPFDRQVLELVFQKKYPLKKAAARLHISLSAVKSRASRLRQKISALARKLLADWG